MADRICSAYCKERYYGSDQLHGFTFIDNSKISEEERLQANGILILQRENIRTRYSHYNRIKAENKLKY